jgi:hypothetical protein
MKRKRLLDEPSTQILGTALTRETPKAALPVELMIFLINLDPEVGTQRRSAKLQLLTRRASKLERRRIFMIWHRANSLER